MPITELFLLWHPQRTGTNPIATYRHTQYHVGIIGTHAVCVQHWSTDKVPCTDIQWFDCRMLLVNCEGGGQLMMRNQIS